jgi:bidirectional [NiFe] hydrogenase diaphorase subunit
MPTVEINGLKREVAKDTLLIDVLRAVGVWIPTLCAHGALEHYDSCRLCLVEVEQRGRKRIVTACSYPIRSDCAVRSEAPEAVRARTGMMELLLARAPGSPELKALALRMGIEGTRFPSVTKAERNCILCGLCVRVCAERIGAGGIGFTSRGTDRLVAPPFREASEDCIGCGACAAICPVGSIEVAFDEGSGELEIVPFETRLPARRCADCGVPLTGEPHAKRIEKAAFKTPNAASLCDACKRKRFAETIALARLRVRPEPSPGHPDPADSDWSRQGG